MSLSSYEQCVVLAYFYGPHGRKQKNILAYTYHVNTAVAWFPDLDSSPPPSIDADNISLH